MKNLLLTALLTCGLTTSAVAQNEEPEIDGTTGATKQEQPAELKPVQTPEEKAEARQKRIDKFMDAVSRFHMGGYGEIAMSRNFYTDNPNRYSNPTAWKDAPYHGRFDIPHMAINMSYDFGKGWKFYSEIEFEHGGTGTTTEYEAEDGGTEWETETEKGGEVELEQLWVEKSFAKWANVRLGHIIVPVGLNNAYHEPLNFFTVYRPEGENTILPSTWHQTGVSFWGRAKAWRYEAQFLAGLNAQKFDTQKWINEGAESPLSFEPATKYGVAARVDNFSLRGFRFGLSAYYGHTMGNTYPAEDNEVNYKGALAIASFDFTMKRWNWIVRGQIDYGYLGDTGYLSDELNYERRNKKSPFYKMRSGVGKNAYALGIEAGWDLFSQFTKLRNKQKLYLFGRYDNYSSAADSQTSLKYGYTKSETIHFGVNYIPVPQVVIKADYSNRLLREGYNNEPSLNIGVAYQGQFF